ncbi:hypothetical protein N431DRAFT_512210 [Stipitochalara longipes BDJ]|nr:hypothetical protein N431DRAFT_512210 [Stipitochalara longipes BDJ]
MAFYIPIRSQMQSILSQNLPPLSDEDQSLLRQFNEMKLPLLKEMMQLPMALPNFDFSTRNQGVSGWGMLTPKHELLLGKHLNMLRDNLDIIMDNDKHKTLEDHITKFEIIALLARGITLDTIGWWLFTIRHWPYEIARREAERKIKEEFPEGHVLTKAERHKAMNRFDAEERREMWRREMLYELRTKRTREEAVKMGEEFGRISIDSLLSLITKETEMGQFPGTANTTNYAESKELAIKLSEEDIAESKLYAETFTIPPDYIIAFNETCLKVVKNDNPLAGIEVEVEDEEIEGLLTSLTLQERQKMTTKEREERTLQPIMEKLKNFETEQEAADLGMRFGEVHLSTFKLKGIVTKYDVEVDSVRAFFKGKKEVWLAATPAPTPIMEGYLKDMHRNYDFYFKDYLSGAKDVLRCRTTEGKYKLSEDLLIWKSFRSVEEKAESDFAAQVGDAAAAAEAVEA